MKPHSNNSNRKITPWGKKVWRGSKGIRFLNSFFPNCRFSPLLSVQSATPTPTTTTLRDNNNNQSDNNNNIINNTLVKPFRRLNTTTVLGYVYATTTATYIFIDVISYVCNVM